MAIERFQFESPSQRYAAVTPLVSGTLTLPQHAFVTPIDRSLKSTVPSMCFLVEHAGTRFMFDLGLRGDPKNYIGAIQAHLPNRQPVTHRPSAPETLQADGIDPTNINAVLLSHVHWDHHGDPSEFPNATFYVGHGSLNVVAHGLPGLGSHSHFDPDLFAHSTAREFCRPQVGQPALDATALGPLLGRDSSVPLWQALGPFPLVADLFGDGSIFLVNAPGHLPGHINLLCHVDPRKWMHLGGDVYRDKRLLTGEKQIATWEENGHECCEHTDKAEAMRSIARMGELDSMMKAFGTEVELITAHDAAWFAANQKRFLKVPAS